MGCGSGEPIAAHLVGCGYRMTGVDSSPSIIGMCRSRFPDHQWIVADMRTPNLDQKFDGIIAWDSFFHLMPEDQLAMFPIFRRHAKPGSALMFTSGPQHGEAIGEYRGEALYHASLDPSEYEALLASIGFSVVAHVAEDATLGDIRFGSPNVSPDRSGSRLTVAHRSENIPDRGLRVRIVGWVPGQTNSRPSSEAAERPERSRGL